MTLQPVLLEIYILLVHMKNQLNMLLDMYVIYKAKYSAHF